MIKLWKSLYGTTGHAEVVKVIYDEKKNNLNDLLKIFWESHNPPNLIDKVMI